MIEEVDKITGGFVGFGLPFLSVIDEERVLRQEPRGEEEDG
jgi:hypothetical protein